MKNMILSRVVYVLAICVAAFPLCAAEPEGSPNGLFARDNLVAWCIVPFDAKQRSPRERVKMLRRLGIRKLAYDWRDEHVDSFEEEIVECRRGGIEFFAFWSWHDNLAPLIAKYDVHPQIWITCPSPEGASQETRVQAAAESLLPLVAKTRELRCRLGLYNHGGWGGEPETMVAVCEHLRRRHDAGHVGIVYNFHHGHDHISRFEEAFALMEPYLLCVNLNGMADPATVRGDVNKILPIGEGVHERRMIEVIESSGYRGPIGIIDHRGETDSEETLRENLSGLKQIFP
jgi:hypothetical protein